MLIYFGTLHKYEREERFGARDCAMTDDCFASGRVKVNPERTRKYTKELKGIWRKKKGEKSATPAHVVTYLIPEREPRATSALRSMYSDDAGRTSHRAT